MSGIDPCNIIGEVLGEPANQMRNPVNADYQCPFMNSRCKKSSQRIEGPYPVCSIFKTKVNAVENLIAVCPKRFLETTFIQDIVDHCWTGSKPKNFDFVHEVKMGNVGVVDVVVAELDATKSQVLNFVSVELQAIDITGTYEPAYSALLNGSSLSEKTTYGFNWANVRKRYITQLVSKGFYHHQWGTRIASVLQDHVFNYFQKQLQFDELEPSKSDIVFLVYKYTKSEVDGEFKYRLELDRVVGTSHSSLMMRALYSQPPPKEDFCNRILDKMNK
ncbi:MAG: hypothetical protein L3K26_19105 [Candidatus Hydrogenedentes bacterium]|nr:hypothetical protein [Candidatus Hydrogenedentota bacterium]